MGERVDAFVARMQGPVAGWFEPFEPAVRHLVSVVPFPMFFAVGLVLGIGSAVAIAPHPTPKKAVAAAVERTAPRIEGAHALVMTGPTLIAESYSFVEGQVRPVK